jgi:hypothetical protein
MRGSSSRRWGIRLAGVLAGLAAWLAVASAAWGDAPFPQCNAAPGCSNGWYGGPVSLTWNLNGATNNGGCAPQTYASDTDQSSMPDGSLPPWSFCNATWMLNGGMVTATVRYRIKVETSTPTASVALARPPDFNGWYTQAVAITVGGTAFSGIASCTPGVTYVGPDTKDTTISGNCLDNAGKLASGVSPAFRYDATPPTIKDVGPSRRPDHHGWYNHPVAFRFAGTDATSGLADCTNPTYAGPDSARASAIGSCVDKAGNVATLAVPLRYDATPPCLSADTTPGDDQVFVHWRGCVRMKIVRSPGLGGKKSSVVERGDGGTFKDTRVRNGVRYTYTVTGEDQAGNVATQTVTVVPNPRLLSPAPNARLITPPVLRWTAKLGASYYNVQLYRGRKRILSVWPAHASFALPSRWRFAHHHYRLTPGVYRWYVWPGIGPRSAARYGPAIGSGRFVIVSAGT